MSGTIAGAVGIWLLFVSAFAVRGLNAYFTGEQLRFGLLSDDMPMKHLQAPGLGDLARYLVGISMLAVLGTPLGAAYGLCWGFLCGLASTVLSVLGQATTPRRNRFVAVGVMALPLLGVSFTSLRLVWQEALLWSQGVVVVLAVCLMTAGGVSIPWFEKYPQPKQKSRGEVGRDKPGQFQKRLLPASPASKEGEPDPEEGQGEPDKQDDTGAGECQRA